MLHIRNNNSLIFMEKLSGSSQFCIICRRVTMADTHAVISFSLLLLVILSMGYIVEQILVLADLRILDVIFHKGYTPS